METTGVVMASEVTPKQMPMLWRDVIPANTLTTIAGRSGVGKSTLGCLIAAELSQLGMPGLFSDMEDDLESVMRPRIEVAGADLSKVALVPPDLAPRFPKELDLFERMIVEVGARWAILSPVAAHFHPETRVHDRPTLMRLISLARKHRCAIIAMHHQVQSTSDGEALSRIGGPSGGLAGTSRAAFLYGYDPEDEDRRVLACAKINGVEMPASVAFEHEVVEYVNERGQAIEAGIIRVVGESVAEAKDTLRRARKKRDRDGEAQKWLTTYLAMGEDCTRKARDVREWAARDGIAWQTVLRARVSIRAERFRGGGFGADGFWVWRLADDHPMRAEEPEAVAS